MRFAPGAYRWAGLPMLVGGLVGVAYPPVAVAGLALGIGTLLFFRDPERSPPAGGVLSPADGRVSVVREEDGRVRVGVYMSVTDVHVNRAPLSGDVLAVEHDPGGHWPAFTKASERNERLTVSVDDHEVILIAGALARRITAYVDEGDRLARGQRLGHVAFGSRADVILPPEVDRADVQVEEGDRVRAGETVLAKEP